MPVEAVVVGTAVQAALEQVRRGHSEQAWAARASTTAGLVSLLVLVLALVLAVYILDLGEGKVLTHAALLVLL